MSLMKERLQTINWIDRLSTPRELHINSTYLDGVSITKHEYRKPAHEESHISLEVTQKGSWIRFEIEEFDPTINRTKTTSIGLELDQWESLKAEAQKAGLIV